MAEKFVEDKSSSISSTHWPRGVFRIFPWAFQEPVIILSKIASDTVASAMNSTTKFSTNAPWSKGLSTGGVVWMKKKELNYEFVRRSQCLNYEFVRRSQWCFLKNILPDRQQFLPLLPRGVVQSGSTGSVSPAAMFSWNNGGSSIRTGFKGGRAGGWSLICLRKLLAPEKRNE